MHLERQRDVELARRRGLTIKTILGVIWFGLCFAAAWFVVSWLLAVDLLSYDFIYSRLFVPRTIDSQVIFWVMVVVVVVLINFFVLLGFAIASPIGRRRPGRPRRTSDSPDPNAEYYDYL